MLYADVAVNNNCLGNIEDCCFFCSKCQQSLQMFSFEEIVDICELKKTEELLPEALFSTAASAYNMLLM